MMETEALLDLDIFADEDHHRLNMQSPTTDIDKSDMIDLGSPLGHFDDKLHDENELELLKSQDSVLWGEEESDSEDFLTNNSYLTAGDILSQRADINVPSLSTDDMKNIFGSPASVKSSTSRVYGTDSEHSVSDADDEESDKEIEVSKTSQKGTKDKKEKAPKKSAVNSEVEAVEKLEKGPSEAELRRRRLIEIDEDEMEDRVERLNKVALKAISSGTGWSPEEQQKQLKECREFLMKYIRLPEYEEIVEDAIDKHNSRVYAIEGTPAVDAVVYLRNEKGVFSDEEVSKKGDVVINGEKMIELSDSDDSDNDTGTPVSVPIVEVKKEVAVSTISASTSELLNKRKALYEASLNKPKTSRAMLLTSLRQKVHETARENYCNQNKIQVEQLALRLEISEKSRILVELLKERHESKTILDRESRRQRYLNMANDEDEEFNEEDEFEEGQFMSAEERERLIISLRKEQEEESEEEDNNDDIDVDNEEDENELEGGQSEDEDGEVDHSSQRSDNEMKTFSSIQNDITDAMEEEDPEPTVRLSRKHSSVVDGDEIENNTLLDDDEIRPIVTYGRRNSSVSIDNNNSGERQEDTMVDSDNEIQPTLVEPVVLKKPKAKTGNSLYRLQLEEEARRHKSEKKNSLFEDEADEEEEEAHQAGLGDFGFGTLSSHKEMDEERDALKLRKGDLDHIVDDVSDGEGDEEEAVRARVDMEIREDRERTKQVIAAVTEGHDASRKKNKGKYSFDRLVADRKKVNNNSEVVEEEEEYDEEEMLQRGLQDKYERERTRSKSKQYNSDSESEEEESSDAENNIYDIMASETLTEEEKKIEVDKINSLREAERIEALRRKQTESYIKMRREMRRRQQYAVTNSTSGAVEVKTSTMTFEPLEPTTSNVSVIKRRTSIAPKHFVKSRPPSSLSRTSSLLNTKISRVPSTTMYKGELNQNEVKAGYGMGMAVTASEGFGGLFSAVTGIKRGASDTLPLPGSLKRTFSSSVSKRSNTLTSTVASHQFVFTGAGETSMHGATMMDTNFSNAGVSKAGPSYSMGGESSLFAKLGSRADLNKNKK